MENIFQNSPKSVNGLFRNAFDNNEGKILQGGHENLFAKKESEPNILFEQSFLKEKKRINDIDNKLLFKKNVRQEEKCNDVEISGDNIFEKSYKKNNFLKKYFPKLYGRKILRAVNKRIEFIENSTKNENVKQIPYGESEKRYENLAHNLSEINYLQSKLNNEIR